MFLWYPVYREPFEGRTLCVVRVVCFLILLAGAVVILLKHVENIRRIRKGSEMRISYLWNRDKEMERMRSVYSDKDHS